MPHKAVPHKAVPHTRRRPRRRCPTRRRPRRRCRTRRRRTRRRRHQQRRDTEHTELDRALRCDYWRSRHLRCCPCRSTDRQLEQNERNISGVHTFERIYCNRYTDDGILRNQGKRKHCPGVNERTTDASGGEWRQRWVTQAGSCSNFIGTPALTWPGYVLRADCLLEQCGSQDLIVSGHSLEVGES